jgi:hypothetical protein
MLRFLFVLPFLFNCSGSKSKNTKIASAPHKTQSVVRNVILDTDIGTDFDDFIALVALLDYHKAGKINLVALTVSGEQPQIKQKIARAVLNHARLGIPVYLGLGEKRIPSGEIPVDYLCSKNPMRPRFFSGFFPNHGAFYHANGKEKKAPAPDALLTLSKQYENLELICIGGLSNIGAALSKDKTLLSRFKKISFMGGHRWDRDFTTVKRLGHNWAIDAWATQRMLANLKTLQKRPELLVVPSQVGEESNVDLVLQGEELLSLMQSLSNPKKRSKLGESVYYDLVNWVANRNLSAEERTAFSKKQLDEAVRSAFFPVAKMSQILSDPLTVLAHVEPETYIKTSVRANYDLSRLVTAIQEDPESFSPKGFLSPQVPKLVSVYTEPGGMFQVTKEIYPHMIKSKLVALVKNFLSGGDSK